MPFLSKIENSLEVLYLYKNCGDGQSPTDMHSIYPITWAHITLAHLFQHLTNISALLKFFHFSKAFSVSESPAGHQCMCTCHLHLSSFCDSSASFCFGYLEEYWSGYFMKISQLILLSICLILSLGLYIFIAYQGCILSTWLIPVDVNLITWLNVASGRGCFTVQLCFLLSLCCVLWKEVTMYSPNLGNREMWSISLRTEYL